MKTVKIACVIALFCMVGGPAFAGTINITSKPEEAEQYRPFVLRFDLPYVSGNPNDAEQIRADAFITAPSGKEAVTPAFCSWNKPSDGKSSWEMRFTPTEKGKHSCFVEVRSGLKSEKTSTFSFNVKAGKGDGFLRKGENNPFYPVFDSGKTFFGLGHNIAWTSGNSVQAFEMYFKDYEKNGCNIARIWINAPWALPIEDKKLGEYNPINCDKLDEIVKLAEKYGVYIILVLDSYGSLMNETGEWNENVWKDNPYNKANGGPCESPDDFFTGPEAKRHYKNRLRYIIARWSYSPNVAFFELWNEMDIPPAWAGEMLSFIKETNPHGQLLTTSLGYPWGNNFDEHEIWGLEDNDIVQWHVYGERIRDVIGNLVSVNSALSNIYDNKMILVGEFSMDSSSNDKNYDPNGEGVALHNSIWASALSRSFSSALNWWWSGYVRGKNLYPHYAAFKKFLEGIALDSDFVDFARTTLVMYERPEGEKVTYSDVRISTRKKWGERDFMEFNVKNNGDVDGGLVNGYLHGRIKSKYRVSPIFYVNYPVDGKFVVHVDLVSQGGTLVVYLDGKKVLSREFPVGPDKGPWKRSLYRKDKNVFQCDYDTDVEIDVPRGRHTVQLENTGKDWIGIKNITLTNYKTSRFANARSLGMVIGDETLLWVQNMDYNWRNVYGGVEIPEIRDAFIRVKVPGGGEHEVEWWDTFEGKVTRREKVTAEKNRIDLKLPVFQKDIACKIRKR